MLIEVSYRNVIIPDNLDLRFARLDSAPDIISLSSCHSYIPEKASITPGLFL